VIMPFPAGCLAKIESARPSRLAAIICMDL
jgi:hypothetical protein